MVTASVAIRQTDLFAVVMLFGTYSFLIALLFMELDAVDVAFTEASIGTGIGTVLMLSTLRRVGRHEKRHRRYPLIALGVVLATGAALFYGLSDIPTFGDPNAPIHQHVAPRYIASHEAEVGVPNLVTAVLATFRGHDTLGETTVILMAGLSVFLLLGLREHGPVRSTRPAIGDTLVLRVVVKVLIAFLLLFALYVQFHGDYGAGGGFQAGVIFATAFLVYDLVFGVNDMRQVLPMRWLPRLAVFGALLYLGTGVASMLLGGNFLDYDKLAADPVAGQHLGILLIEAGVGITVFASILLIAYAFSGIRKSQPQD